MIKELDSKMFLDGMSVSRWDFSTANKDEKSRIHAITKVASICYQSPTALDSEILYNRLKRESIGLPSSSFEFIPVLLNLDNPLHREIVYKNDKENNVCKFGEVVAVHYYLTNYRAIVTDKAKFGEKAYSCDPEMIFNNTEEERAIIYDNFFVFLQTLDLPTRSQNIRHRVNWQELSRRYVSGKRVPFAFYTSEKMKNVVSNGRTTQDIYDICVEHYNAAIKDGVKPEDARRIIPQAMLTDIWSGFRKSQLTNYLNLRTDSHTQYEFRLLAKTIKSFIK